MRKTIYLVGFLLVVFRTHGQESNLLPVQNNKPERLEWFSGLGLGMFIHWSMDVQVGSVISHSMVGASEEYLENYFALQDSFEPQKFNPKKWAKLAKLAGFQYMVFTTKHHNGFCMYDTKTTDFNVMNTPFGKDATREIFDAFREEGIAIGVYFSPEDWKFIHEQGVTITRDHTTKANPEHNPELNSYVKEQLKELLTNYGKIDIVFLDGMMGSAFLNTEFAAYCWELQPDVVVTRGGMETPEQRLPQEPLSNIWEACFTMGTQWQYKPTNEVYKSGTTVINMLLETRAKNGNLLLNVGPTPDGEIPIEQESILRELGLWMLVNKRAVQGTLPYKKASQDNLYFTQSKDGKSLFVAVTDLDWKHGERKEFLIEGVQVEENGKVEVLGHNGEVVVYKPDLDAKVYWKNTDRGLEISAVRGQRLYNNFKWPNPVVVEVIDFKDLNTK
ncbi:alpha-L-fucosidase [Algoriphagus confluentis]|uniref:alpha-L-fucosidase n=1 Tax=Algoriphagus confluentis TaxID=1697556 RepID=A0ABQ6PM92_9BACT|nr:alpha-L-fucosidase [Algoriphagus confluentis]